MLKFIIPLFLLALTGSGCGLRAREEALQKKESAIAEKEQQLLLKEKELTLKGEEIAQWVRKMDSTNAHIDSTLRYDSNLVARWNVRMTCTEASCPGSAVGDTKQETWDIAYQNKNVIAQAFVNNELIRTYSGSFDGNTLSLSADVASDGTNPPTRMLVRLTQSSEKAMEGQREIIRENDCRIVYNLQLGKQTPTINP